MRQGFRAHLQTPDLTGDNLIKWCRSRDLNPDERNSLPPQDSVSTNFHHFGILYVISSEPIRLLLPFLILLTSGMQVCQYENRSRFKPDAILPSAEPLVQVVRSRPVMRSPEREPPVAGVVPAPLVSRLRPGMHLPSPISLYVPLRKTGSAR
jgi:hypothetical protein